MTTQAQVLYFSTDLPVDVLLGGHASPLVDPLLQLGHGALPLGHPLRSCPGHKTPPQHHVLLLLPGVVQWAGTPLWVSLRGTVLTVTPRWRRFVIAVVGHDVARVVVAPTIWMVIWVGAMVRTWSTPTILTFSSSSVILFSLLIGAGGGG